jgi:hypothetical protein
MSSRTEYIWPALSAQRQGSPRGDVLSKSWRPSGNLAAQTAQAHVLALVAPPAPAAKSLGVASGVDAPLSACSFGDTLFSVSRLLHRGCR